MGRRKSALEGLVMNSTFWCNKTVLITGHTGFKGSWLSMWLKSKGANVIGYALAAPTTPSLFETASVSNGMTSIIKDVRKLSALREVISSHKPEIVIHMAAQALVRKSYEDPIGTYTTNVLGTTNVLEAIRQTDGHVRVALMITTDKCYENQEWIWGYRESDILGGYDPYSNSKACAELVTAAYRRSFFPESNYKQHGVALATARAGNVIGGGDWSKDRLIPDVFRSLVDNSPLTIRNPNAERPWQHVLEPLDGYLCLVEHLWHDGAEFSSAWNFGPDDKDCKSVLWVANQMAGAWGSDRPWVQDKADNPHEANYLKLDCSKARKLLNWSPKLDLPKALQWVIEWYKTYTDGENMHKFSIAQISEYEEIS